MHSQKVGWNTEYGFNDKLVSRLIVLSATRTSPLDTIVMIVLVGLS